MVESGPIHLLGIGILVGFLILGARPAALGALLLKRPLHGLFPILVYLDALWFGASF